MYRIYSIIISGFIASAPSKCFSERLNLHRSVMDKDWKKVKKELTCGLCQDLLTNPKILPCFHSFCEGCLTDQLVVGKSECHLECPLCKTKMPSTPNSIEELPSPFYITRLVEVVRLHEQVVNRGAATPICQHCDDGEEAVSCCSDCCIFLCNFCDKSHKKAKATKEHKIFSLDEMRGDIFKPFHSIARWSSRCVLSIQPSL